MYRWFGFGIDGMGQPRRPEWINVAVLGVLLPAGSLWALWRIVTTHTGAGVWITAAALYTFTLFGVTVGNHRYWTHRGFKARGPLRAVLALASAMSVQGSIESWVLTHRAHHRFTDVVGVDPHTPYEYREWRGWKGIAWAQGVWLLFERPAALQLEPQKDLTEDTLVQREGRAFPYLAIGQFVVLLACYPLGGLNLFLIAGPLRVVALMTATGMVNSVCHRWGGRAQDSAGRIYRRDDSRNNLFVAVVSGGEGNHAWHHAEPSCPRHGRRIQLDPEAVARGVHRDRVPRPDVTWRMIQLLELLHLVYDVKRPRRTVHFSPAQCRPKPELAAVLAGGFPIPDAELPPEPVGRL
jgi:stearoyl-CoA desaturase (delta-9 desaturase)